MAQKKIGFDDSLNMGAGDMAFKRLFTPEFRNRLDARIPFAALAPEAMERIVSKFVRELEAQLADREVTLELTEKAREWLAKKGFDKAMGARPLSRVIQEEIKKALTEEILFGALEKGGHAIIDFDPKGQPRDTTIGPHDLTGGLVIRAAKADKPSGGDDEKKPKPELVDA
jgi:ATP-dependent Clp protease ATP-binding subunit ClpA